MLSLLCQGAEMMGDVRADLGCILVQTCSGVCSNSLVLQSDVRASYNGQSNINPNVNRPGTFVSRVYVS